MKKLLYLLLLAPGALLAQTSPLGTKVDTAEQLYIPQIQGDSLDPWGLLAPKPAPEGRKGKQYEGKSTYESKHEYSYLRIKEVKTASKTPGQGTANYRGMIYNNSTEIYYRKFVVTLYCVDAEGEKPVGTYTFTGSLKPKQQIPFQINGRCASGQVAKAKAQIIDTKWIWPPSHTTPR